MGTAVTRTGNRSVTIESIPYHSPSDESAVLLLMQHHFVLPEEDVVLTYFGLGHSHLLYRLKAGLVLHSMPYLVTYGNPIVAMLYTCYTAEYRCGHEVVSSGDSSCPYPS
jgi:hypothetical protein